MSSPVVLLGAQRTDPTLGAAVAEVGITGQIAVVTAGWKEREDEDEELARHLSGRTRNLRLYARANELLSADPELERAYRERQQRLRARMDAYRVRLACARQADEILRQRKEMLDDETRVSNEVIRALDASHLARCREHHRAFEETLARGEHPELARHRREIAAIIEACDAVAIAGGHVATLRNRLALFEVARMIGARPLFAWSGGAMVVTEKVVLFHDDAPQGPVESELMDDGLGLLPGVVAFPAPEQRLDFDRTEHIAALAKRFAPARCVALPARARVRFEGERPRAVHLALELLASGEHAPLAEAPS